ncbi:MAG: GGDEF domain-containing protein [Lachnospiraceae bacterium]|nr:GGDEF domain-containing protein [Lachnospiraceae bacterium]
MNLEKFNHYGYDNETYNTCIDLIRETNRHHLTVINTWFLFINIFHIMFSYFSLFGMNSSNIPLYAISIVPAGIFGFLLFAKAEFTKKHIRGMIYFQSFMMIVFSFLFSVSQPYMVAVTYQVYIVLIALSYIVSMVKLSIFTVGFGMIFVAGSFMMKAYAIAYQDAYNTLIFTILALILHYMFQSARLKQYITMITNEKISQELAIKSHFDTLTDLVNRATFGEMANMAVPDIAKGKEFAVLCMMDLDKFKQINDVYGHQTGDQAIRIAGAVIEETLGIDLGDKWSYPDRAINNKTSFAGRLGGDEFICLIRGTSGTEEIDRILTRLLKNLNTVRIDAIDGLHCSIGYTVIREEDRDLEAPYHRADDALYESKKAGKNQFKSNN